MEYVIRKCVEKDLPALVDLCQKHADHEEAAYHAAGKEELLQKAIFSANAKLHCFIVEHSGQAAGYFTYTFDFSTWDAQQFLYLDCLYLEPAFRGMRIGETIFEQLKSTARENHCINIQWQTPDFNIRAIKFYNRIGGTGKNKVRFFINV